MLRRVYIDEAGDRGRRPGSSDHFVLSAVIVNDARESIARAELATVKRTLGRKPSDVLHFRNLTHSQKVKACQEVANFSIERVTSVILCKRSIQQPFQGGGLAYISQPDPMYLWAIRLLLERISWHLRDTGGGSSIVTFAHLSRFKAAKLHDYRQALWFSTTTIHWPSFDGHQFRLNHPNTIDLLQLADSCASAVYRAVEPDQFGNVEARYLTSSGRCSTAVLRAGSRPTGSRCFRQARPSPGARCTPCGSTEEAGRPVSASYGTHCVGSEAAATLRTCVLARFGWIVRPQEPLYVSRGGGRRLHASRARTCVRRDG